MVGICFKYDAGYQGLLRDQMFELVLAFPGLEVYERETHEDDIGDYNGTSFTSVTNADDLPPEPTLVLLSGEHAQNIQGEISLADYVHPENAIYFFGDDHGDLEQADIGVRTDYDKVCIPISEQVWSAQAVAMVLYDRKSKE